MPTTVVAGSVVEFASRMHPKLRLLAPPRLSGRLSGCGLADIVALAFALSRAQTGAGPAGVAAEEARGRLFEALVPEAAPRESPRAAHMWRICGAGARRVRHVRREARAARCRCGAPS